MHRWVVWIALAGCVESSAVVCGEKVCPSGTHCDTLGRCITDEQESACANIPEGDPCANTDGAGECISGACISARCGDDIRVGTEQCDGDDLGGASCGSLGFYTEGTGLACNDQCQFNTLACEGGRCGDGVVDALREQCEPNIADTTVCTEVGFYEDTAVQCTGFCTWNTSTCSARCGDGIIQADAGEVCDGAPPANSCLTFGFDYGPIGCAQCGPSFARCGTVGWVEQIPSPQIIQSISGTADDLWVSRVSFVTRRRNFGPWETMLDNTSAGRSLVVRGLDDVFVAGGVVVQGVQVPTVEHYNGTTWTREFLPGATTGTSTADIVMLGTELYAVTGEGLYRRDTTWSRVASVSNAFALWAAAANDIYIVTAPPTQGLVRWNGTAMTPVTLPGACTNQPADVWGTSGTNVFVACAGGVARYTGTWAMSLLATSARVVTGSSADHVVVGGSSGQAWVFDGTDWYDAPISGVGGVDAIWTDGVSIVAALFGGIQVLDRVALQAPTNEAFEQTPEDAWGFGRDFYVSMQQGNLLRRTSNTPWVDASPPGTAGGPIWGFATNDFYVGGGSVIWRWNGSWSSFATSSSRTVVDLWGPTSNDLWAVSRANGTLYIDRYNGSWSNVTSVADSNGQPTLYGTSPNNVWLALGTSGTAYHWNGSTLTPHTFTGQAVRFVYPLGPTNALAATNLGLFRWDGTSWTEEDPGVEVVWLSIWARAADDVFVGGALGTVVHYDGTRWSQIRSPRPSQTAIVALTGTADRVLFVRDETGGGDLLYQFAPFK